MNNESWRYVADVDTALKASAYSGKKIKGGRFEGKSLEDARALRPCCSVREGTADAWSIARDIPCCCICAVSEIRHSPIHGWPGTIDMAATPIDSVLPPDPSTHPIQLLNSTQGGTGFGWGCLPIHMAGCICCDDQSAMGTLPLLKSPRVSAMRMIRICRGCGDDGLILSVVDDTSEIILDSCQGQLELTTCISMRLFRDST